MAISKSDLKLYLTSLDPDVEQTVYSQSLGGYPAIVKSDLTKSLLYPETTLSANRTLFGNEFSLTDYSKISGKTYLSVNGEIVKVPAISSSTITATERAVNNLQHIHLSGDAARGVVAGVLSDNFSDSFKQYRCFALKNNSNFQIAYGLKVYLKQNSRNFDSKIKIAVEAPVSDYLSSATSSNSSDKKQVISSALADLFEDNHFTLANLRFTSGNNINQARVIQSYDAASGVIMVDSSFPFLPVSGELFEIDPAPSQRIMSGIDTPDFNSDYVSGLSLATSDEAIEININGNRDHGSDLLPGDVVYIWLERSLLKTGEGMNDNSAVITFRYSES